MGKINRCIKGLFISLNTLFAINGCLMIFGAIPFSINSDQLSEVSSSSLVWIWLFAISFLGISCLGIYAGFTEKEIILKIFAGLMVVGMIIMLIFGILLVVERNELSNEVIFSMALNISLGYAVFALLGLLLSLLMIHQVRRPDSSEGTSIAMRGYSGDARPLTPDLWTITGSLSSQ